MTEDREAQEDELLALTSIYPKEFQRARSKPGGKVLVCVDLPQDFKVAIRTADIYRQYAVSFLPPLVLDFELPMNYPSISSPVCKLNCKWLSSSQLEAVQQHLEELWQEGQGSVVLFSWIQFFKEDLLNFLQIHSPLEVCRDKENKENCRAENVHGAQGELLGQDARSASDILLELLDFDETERQRTFDSHIFSCGVCFSEKLGLDCIRFRDCNHVHCRACLAEFFALRIRDSQVRDLRCPQPQCSAIATPSQVKQLVSEELFLRYDRLLLQSSLDEMTDITYCPRQTCAAPVLLEPEGNMALCPACAYAFCPLCRRGYHGMSGCRSNIPQIETVKDDAYVQVPQKDEGLQSLWEDYATGSTERKKVLEKRYGKEKLNMTIAEQLSSVWIGKNSKDCPVCKIHIQKDYGCNRMTCISCHMEFCWNCLTVLHYRKPHYCEYKPCLRTCTL